MHGFNGMVFSCLLQALRVMERPHLEFVDQQAAEIGYNDEVGHFLI